jgi:hypothetical protein
VSAEGPDFVGGDGVAAETGLTMSVCHHPPGTSKWNRIDNAEPVVMSTETA